MSTTPPWETLPEHRQDDAQPPGGIAAMAASPPTRCCPTRLRPTSLGEADYVNANGSPQDAMNFWLANGTRDIFPNCGMQDMATAVWTQNGQFAAVLLAATPAAPLELPISPINRGAGQR